MHTRSAEEKKKDDLANERARNRTRYEERDRHMEVGKSRPDSNPSPPSEYETLYEDDQIQPTRERMRHQDQNLVPSLRARRYQPSEYGNI